MVIRVGIYTKSREYVVTGLRVRTRSLENTQSQRNKYIVVRT